MVGMTLARLPRKPASDREVNAINDSWKSSIRLEYAEAWRGNVDMLRMRIGKKEQSMSGHTSTVCR